MKHVDMEALAEAHAVDKPYKPKVYAFDPPVHSSKNNSIEEKGAEAYHTAMGDHAPDSHTGRIGTGAYYKALGMRSTDVDRRTRANNQTGKDYLEVRASYGRK